MSRRFIGLGLLILLFTICGCRATRSIKTNIKEAVISSAPEDRFARSVDSNELSQAERIWIDNRDYFLEKPKALEEITKAASNLKKSYKPKISAATTNVLSIHWPEKSAKWTLIRLKLDNARDLVDEIESCTILSDLGQIPPGLAKLKNKLHEKENIIRSDARPQFKKYPLQTGPNFFSIYPVKLDEEKFLQSQAALLERTVGSATGEGVPHMIKEYGDIIPAKTMRNMEGQYFRNLLKKESQGRAPTFRTVIRTMKKAQKMGFPVTEVPNCKIAFVRVTSKSLMAEHGIEFGLGFDVDLPMDTETLEKTSMFNANTAKDADVVILINEVVSRIDRKTFRPKSYRSRYITGYHEGYNHAYDQAQLRLEQLKLKRQELNNRNNYHILGWFGANDITSAAHQAAIEEQKYDEAVANATNIPKMIDKPIYAKYGYRVVPIRTTKIASVQYIIIDRKSRTYFTDFFDIAQEKNFKIAYGVDPDDPDRLALTKRFNTDKEVREWEKKVVPIRLSDMLNHYLEHQEKDKKYRNMARIQKTIMNNRNKALAAFYSDKYESDTGNDPRFDSTVMVWRPDRMAHGSGFFVTSNIILTNHHVVEGDSFVEIRMHNNQEAFGKVMAFDLYRDLALVKINAHGKPVRFYTKNTLPAGVTLEAIGGPAEFPFTITRGIFSAYRKRYSHHLPSRDIQIRYIQTDAAINPGNSGGPLFYKNKVVGVNSCKIANQEVDNLAFAVHYAEVIEFLEQYGIKYRK
ncbi:S1C family serine protease [Maridesulfovibrio sp.]|uniref:S1C family serine protease n=1 Tax=Maridesulfovibrio sp. TaxID=2795000 RepID=UPI0029CA14DE|nr:S1C family serine protease [Maridesulfovibrio sp.]